MYHPGQTPTRLFSHYLNQLRHPWPNTPDVSATGAKALKDSWDGRYLQLAPFLCDESVEWKNEDDSGNSCQSWRAKMLNKRKDRIALKRPLRKPHLCMNGRHCKQKCYISAYLPEEEETEHNLNRSQPDSVEVHHKVHELLGVCWNQIHNLAHGASPPGSAVYHQRLDWQQKRQWHLALSALCTI